MIHVAVYGASGFGREIMPLVKQQWLSYEGPHQFFFVDDNPLINLANGHPVISYADWLTLPASDRFISIAIANSILREQLALRCKTDGIKFFDVRATNVVSMDDVSIGDGSILCPFVTLTSNISIGSHFHGNINSYVAHDCVIGNFVTFAPGVHCNGNVVIEDHAYIGAGAIIKQGLPGLPTVIGKCAVVGMGAVVTKSVPAGTTVIGNPARPLNSNNRSKC